MRPRALCPVSLARFRGFWFLRGFGGVGVNQIGELATPVGVFFGGLVLVDDRPYSFCQSETVSSAELIFMGGMDVLF